jgi:hypothetical protein
VVSSRPQVSQRLYTSQRAVHVEVNTTGLAETGQFSDGQLQARDVGYMSHGENPGSLADGFLEGAMSSSMLVG